MAICYVLMSTSSLTDKSPQLTESPSRKPACNLRRWQKDKLQPNIEHLKSLKRKQEMKIKRQTMLFF